MLRTLNYTGRKRIARNKIHLDVVENENHVMNLDANIHIDNLDLPSQATVYLEAYSRAGIKRYLFGKVEKFNPIGDLSLPSATSLENLQFRVLVVDESGTIGRILAVADRIRLSTADKGTTRSILPVVTADLGRLVWRIDFEEDQPTLVLNENIPDVMHIAAHDVRFFEYVYPAVIKEILTHLIWFEGIDDIDDMDPDDWKLQWLRFTEQYVPADTRPELNKGSLDFDSELVGQWIDDVVREFCSNNVDLWEALLKEVEVPEI
jgi:hypothetical protein